MIYSITITNNDMMAVKICFQIFQSLNRLITGHLRAIEHISPQIPVSSLNILNLLD